MNNKIEYGQFFTKGNPFLLKPFKQWFFSINPKMILEPFAGGKDIANLLNQMGYTGNYTFYDIEPQHSDIIHNDSIKNFPNNFNVCITNPPYLAKNSATRKGIVFDSIYDDLYKLSLEKMLINCQYVAAIIPDSFINSGLFKNMIEKYIILNFKMFNDTTCPVALVLFNNKKNNSNFEIYESNEYLGTYYDLNYNFKDYDINIKYNCINANYYANLIDSSRDNIYFGNNLKSIVKHTDRAQCNVFINANIDVHLVNEIINDYRIVTKNVFLTSFKGLKNDGHYRKRMDFRTANKIIKQSFNI